MKVMEQIYCKYCGKLIDNESSFCKYCGRKVDESPNEINIQSDSSYLKIIYHKSITFLLSFTYKIKRILQNLRSNIKELFFLNRKKIIMGISFALILFFSVYSMPYLLLYNAVSDITKQFETSNDSTKCEYAMNILDKYNDWNYWGVSNYAINNKLKYENIREKAFEYIESQASNGIPNCQYSLGRLYFHNRYSVKNDTVKAVYWWNEAANNGYSRAFNNLGMAYKNGYGVNCDFKKAVEWLKKGADSGEKYAQFNYGDLFRDGVKIRIGSHKEIKNTTNYLWLDEDKIVKKVWDDKVRTYRVYYWEEVDDFQMLIPKDIEQAKYWWKKISCTRPFWGKRKS